MVKSLSKYYCYVGLYEFVPLSQKLRHYAPDKWKSSGEVPPPITLRLAVKYFPPQPYKFVNPMTRLQFFLNLRSLILDGKPVILWL